MTTPGKRDALPGRTGEADAGSTPRRNRDATTGGRLKPEDLDAAVLRDVAGKSIRGGASLVVSEVVCNAFRLLGTIVLARLLTPEHFGLISMVVAITSFVELFRDFGLSTATVQKQDITEEQISALFWINVAVGVGLAAILAAASPVIAWFYGDERLFWISMSVSSTFFFGGLAVQHQALLRRRMQFPRLAAIQVLSTSLSTLLAIALAWLGFGYWALVLKEVSRVIVQTSATWLLSGWVPGRPRRSVGVGELVQTGLHITGNNIVVFASGSIDQVLLGRFWGAHPLGLYKQARQLLLMPVSLYSFPVTYVMTPALSALQADAEGYRKYYRTAVAFLAFGYMPITAFCAVCAQSIITLLLGRQWLDASPVLRVLAIASFVSAISATSGIVMITSGRTRAYFKWGLIQSSCMVLSFAVGVRWGAIGLAWSWVAYTYAALFPEIWYAFRGTPLRLGDFFNAIWRPAIASVVMAGVLLVFRMVVGTLGAAADLLASLAVAPIAYAAGWLLLPQGRLSLLSHGRQARQAAETIASMVRTAPRSPAPASAAEHRWHGSPQGMRAAMKAEARASATAHSGPGARVSSPRASCPLVSILIPAYKAEQFIEGAIRCAVSQSWPRKEVIVVDDGSTDGTFAMASALASHMVKVVRQDNGGAAAARNTALGLSQGDYIQWLDADDLLSVDKIARQMRVFEEGATARTLVSSPWGRFYHRPWKAVFAPSPLWEDLAPTEWIMRKWESNSHMQTATWLASRELTEAGGPWDTRLLTDDDGEYFSRLMVKSDGIRFVPEARVYYRTSPLTRLSYLGVSDHKIDAQLLAMELQIGYLRSLCDDDRARQACTKYLETWMVYFHPNRPDVVSRCRDLALSWGSDVRLPRLSWKYEWIRLLLGWQTARYIQRRSNELKTQVLMTLDRAMARARQSPLDYGTL